MCGNTKQRIADALRQLMTEKPFEKITVRNLMDATNMKRQSFYYHFRDTRDVLMWICRQRFMLPLRESSLEIGDWIILAMRLLDADRSFYRKAFRAIFVEFVTEFDETVMVPRLRAQLYPGTAELDDNRSFLAEFVAQALTNRMLQFVHSRTPLNEQRIRERTTFLLKTLEEG